MLLSASLRPHYSTERAITHQLIKAISAMLIPNYSAFGVNEEQCTYNAECSTINKTFSEVKQHRSLILLSCQRPRRHPKDPCPLLHLRGPAKRQPTSFPSTTPPLPSFLWTSSMIHSSSMRDLSVQRKRQGNMSVVWASRRSSDTARVPSARTMN